MPDVIENAEFVIGNCCSPGFPENKEFFVRPPSFNTTETGLIYATENHEK